jgi:hypothetical protein
MLKHAISKTIKRLHEKNTQNTTTANQEWRTPNAIKKKITEYSLKITQADRGKTLVIIHQQECNKTIAEFIQANQLTHNTTNQY